MFVLAEVTWLNLIIFRKRMVLKIGPVKEPEKSGYRLYGPTGV